MYGWRGETRETNLIVATVHTESGSHGDSTAEEEEGVEHVQNEGDRSAGHDSSEGACDQEDERQHREDCDKHVVVDDGGVSGKGVCDDAADERQDEQSPEKL